MKSFATMMKYALIAALFLTSADAALAQTPKKRVLVEDGTGAWCGYCPNGTTALEELLEKYPDQVIGVAMHNKSTGRPDAMALAEEPQFSTAYINGYPNGVIDRKFHPGYSSAKSGIGSNAWEPIVVSQLEEGTTADVNITNLKYVASTRTLTFDVTSNFTTALSGDYRFNAYIVEDSVIGTGSGYDQTNYMDADPSSPWYKKGNPIKNFVHRNVVRKVMDGMFGASGSLPTAITPNTPYSKSYSVVLPSTWKEQRVSVVGFVMKYNTVAAKHEVLNAAQVSATLAPPVYAAIAVDQKYTKVARNATSSNTVTITNSSAFSYPVNLTINTDKSTLPAGWTATVEPAQVVVPAGGTATATVKVTAGSNAALAQVAVNAIPAPDPTVATGKLTTTAMFALTADAKYVVLGGLSNGSGLFPTTLEGMPAFKNDAVMLPNDTKILEAYPLASFDVAIIPIDYFGRGHLGGDAVFNNELPVMVQNMLNSGKKVFIMSEIDATYAAGQNGSAEAKALYENTLGIEPNGDPVLRVTVNSNNQITGIVPFTASGVDNDIVGNGITVQANASTDAYVVMTDMLQKTTGSTAIPILYFDNDPSKIAGIRVENGSSKAVYMTFGLDAIADEESRIKLFNRVMSYLTGISTGVAGISVDNALLDYEEVKIGEQKELSFTISSNGELPLEISSMNITGEASSSFTIKNAPTLPKTLAVGEEMTVTVIFTPSQKGTMIANLNIISNGEGTNSITLSGEAVEGGSSVAPFTAGSLEFLTVSVGPNPASEKSLISYSVNGLAPQTVELSIVDALGNTVHSFGVQTLVPGSYTQEINAAALAAGSYRLVARSNEAAVQVPFVIAR